MLTTDEKVHYVPPLAPHPKRDAAIGRSCDEHSRRKAKETAAEKLAKARAEREEAWFTERARQRGDSNGVV